MKDEWDEWGEWEKQFASLTDGAASLFVVAGSVLAVLATLRALVKGGYAQAWWPM